MSIGIVVLALLALGEPNDDQRQAVPSTLPASARAHLKSATLAPIAHVDNLPAAVRSALTTLFGSERLEMAEPGAAFQSTDAIMTPDLPVRRLITAGCARDLCLVHYERGGVAHTYQVALLALSPERARFQWGGLTSGPIQGLAELKSLVVEGRVRGPVPNW